MLFKFQFKEKCTIIPYALLTSSTKCQGFHGMLCMCLCICRTADLVEGVLQGRNGSVFCYGATGAGKTFTMLGTVENPGVMVLAIKDLFSKIRQRSYDGNHSVQLSYLEVYNETVRDLLSPGRPLVLREDKQVSFNCLPCSNLDVVQLSVLLLINIFLKLIYLYWLFQFIK